MLNTTKPMAMESVEPCILCHSNSSSFSFVLSKGGDQLMRCSKCNLLLITPRENEQQIYDQYCKQSIYGAYYAISEPTNQINFNKRLALIESKIPKSKLLDIGCSVGTFMNAAEKRGWQVKGLDANPNTCKICREKGFEVYETLFTEECIGLLKKEKFDFISMNDTIEHFPNPLEALQWTYEILPERGTLSLTTPNMNSMLTKFFQIKPKEHLFYFTSETLSALVRKAGFKINFTTSLGKRRCISAMPYGSTIHKHWLNIARFLSHARLDKGISVFLEHFFKDELFLLAHKEN